MRQPTSTPGWQRLIAALILFLISPMLALVSAVVPLSSRGPVTYRARRVGVQGEEFTMYKFRTMRSGPAGERSVITGSADPRVFPVGRVLRSLKIDELPQLVNVVRGEMALVGPRPEDPRIVACYYSDWMRRTLEVPPGLTSPASLDYFATESMLPPDGVEAEKYYVTNVLPLKLAMELVYVESRSTRYDMKLIGRTVLSILRIRAWSARTSDAERAKAEALLKQFGEQDIETCPSGS